MSDVLKVQLYASALSQVLKHHEYLLIYEKDVRFFIYSIFFFFFKFIFFLQYLQYTGTQQNNDHVSVHNQSEG